MHTIYDKKILMLKPCEIKLKLKKRPEKLDTFALYSLAQSIKAIGMITPLTVSKDDNGNYILVSGERRLLAAKAIGMRRVPCILHKETDEKLAVFSLCENIQRKNLDFFREAEQIKYLISKYNISQNDLSVWLGIDKNSLLERLRLLRLDENLRMVISECGLSESYARSLLRLPPEKRDLALEAIIKNNLDSYKADEYISEILNPKEDDTQEEKKCEIKAENRQITKSVIGDIRLFGNSLSKLTKTLNNSGIDAFLRRNETEKYIEYKIRIKKDETQKIPAEQLKIC